MKLFTAGYGRWPVATRMDRLIEALTDAGVTLLIDTRHSPEKCPSLKTIYLPLTSVSGAKFPQS
jgi:hypothetical protein